VAAVSRETTLISKQRTNMNPVFALMAFAIGVVVPLQAAINNQLKLLLAGSTVLAAMISFAVGTISLALLAVFSGQKFSGLTQLARGEWWMFIGGLLGAFFVFGTTLLAPGWAWRPCCR
jgi:transporter family-2 protein